MSGQSLVEIFCDGNDQVGFGHIRRCLALAAKLRNENISVRLTGLSETAKKNLPVPEDEQAKGSIAVFDSLAGIDKNIQNANEQGQLTITLDWFGETVPDINIVVFPHSEVRANIATYIGFEYIIIRDEITVIPKTTQHKSNKKVLICLGGGDLLEQAADAADMLSDRGFEVTLIQGPFAKKRKVASKKYTTHINPANYSELLANCDWTVVNGGGCFFESLCLGKPSFVLPQTELEMRIALFAQQKNTVLGIGLRQLNSFEPVQLDKVAQNGIKLLDGCGLERITAIIKKQYDTGR